MVRSVVKKKIIFITHHVCTIKFDIKRFLFDCHTNWLDLIDTLMYLFEMMLCIQSTLFARSNSHEKSQWNYSHFLKLSENISKYNEQQNIDVIFVVLKHFTKQMNVFLFSCCPNDDNSNDFVIGIKP